MFFRICAWVSHSVQGSVEGAEGEAADDSEADAVQKLFKLRSWLTVDEAARHLTIVHGEDVSRADVLRLALDGHLTLSVNFVNRAKAYLGRVVPFKDVPMIEMPPVRNDGAPGSEPFSSPDGIPLEPVVELTGETPFLCFDRDKVASISGVWDLAMQGGEALDVEHEYQALTNGPAVTLVDIAGAFVTRSDGEWAQLLVALERSAGTRVKERPSPRAYVPAGGLPDDSVLVVRTDALTAFQAKLADQQGGYTRSERGLATRERDTLLKLVVGMAIAGYRYSPEASRSEVPTEIARDLAKLGMSVTDDTVRKWLKEAAGSVLPKKPHKF